MESLIAGYTVTAFIDFFLFGLVINIISTIVVILLTVYTIGTLEEEDISKYKSFVVDRHMYIMKNSSSTLRIINNLTMFFPMYKAITGIIYLYYLFKYGGRIGIISGIIKLDKIALIPIINYQPIRSNK